jgi:urea transport system substrate-binding protein
VAGSSADERWFGTYRVLRPLGKGGMGEVYLTEDPALQRKVAVKVLRAEFVANDTIRERFVREARSMAALQHQHIVPVFHIGYHEHTPYIVMPHLRGADLETWIKEGNSVSLLQMLRIAIETASALDAAHEQKLIHRDIKPSNIWLEAPKGHVKLLDFGLCRSVDEITNLTVPGIIIGTPMYRAPENLDGIADERSDLYSLGVVMYEVLTGVQPFAGKTLSQVFTKIVTTTPEPPNASNPSIAPAVNDIIMRLLDRDPDSRVSSARELVRQLRAIYNDLRRNRGVRSTQN